MKKLLSLFLSIIIILSLTACGNEAVPAVTEATAVTETVPTEPESIFASMTEAERAAAEAEIRYAVSLLLDRSYIIEEVTQGEQVPASSFVAMGFMDTDGSQFYENAGSSEEYDGYFNVAPEAYEDNYVEAYKILAKYYEIDENGSFTNFPALTYLYNIEEGQDVIGEYLQSVLAGIGIQIQPEKQELEEFLISWEEGAYSVTRGVHLAEYNDPICFLDMWTSASGKNEVQFGQGAHANVAIYDLDLTEFGYDIKVQDGTWAETYDVLISTIKSCGDNEIRYRMMHIAEDLLMSTGAIVPLYFCTDTFLVDQTVDGVVTTPLGSRYFHKATVNRRGEEISVSLSDTSFIVDPALAGSGDDAILASHLFAGLTKWSQDRNGNMSVVADCADKLGKAVVNEDGTVTYTYNMRRNLKWSDGQPLTANDFEFAWKRAAAMEMESGDSHLFEVIKGYKEVRAGEAGAELAVTAVDERTLQVTLYNPVSYWEELLALPAFYPVREDVVANEDWASDPSTIICNGGYTITDWSNEAVITLEKNMNYWDRSVTMKKIRFFLSDDFGHALTNFRNDTWQFIDQCPINRIASLKADYPDEFTSVNQISTFYLCWNINEPLLP